MSPGWKEFMMSGPASLAKLVRPAAVHAYAFDAANADQLDAYIVAAVALIRKGNQAFGGAGKIGSASHQRADLVILQGAVQAVRAEDQQVAGKDLMIAGFDAYEHIGSERAAE